MKITFKNLLAFAVIALVFLAQTALTANAYSVIYPFADQTSSSVNVTGLEVDNRTFDPYDGQEAEVTFFLNTAAQVTIEVLDDDDDEVVTIIDQKTLSKGEYTYEWDGEDEYGDIVRQDEYTFEITARANGKKDVESVELKVRKGAKADEETEKPRLQDAYITKETFDPDRNEVSGVVFTLTAKADVDVKVDGEEIYDKNDLPAGIYFVEIDGNELNEDLEETYEVEVTARNSEGSDKETFKIEVQEDDNNSNKPNIYKDTLDQYPFEPRNNTLRINFRLDREAVVTIEIRDEDDVLIKVVNDADFRGGQHSIGWDGKDKYGHYIGDGIYEYKIIAENREGKNVEYGNFSIANVEGANYNSERCSVFQDVEQDSRYCDAISWAASQEIFEGYSDGTFKPNRAISRVEAIKVIFKALDVKVVDGYGDQLFKDTDRYAWYAPFLKTAVAIGTVDGYNDGTFRPNNTVLRVEALKMILETAEIKEGVVIPSNSYGQPYHDTPNNSSTRWYLKYAWFAQSYNLTDNSTYLFPTQSMTRAEMADMLYRLDQNVL